MGRVIQLLLANPDISRVEIARKTELTKTTISAIITALLDLNIVEETPRVEDRSSWQNTYPYESSGRCCSSYWSESCKGKHVWSGHDSLW